MEFWRFIGDDHGFGPKFQGSHDFTLVILASIVVSLAAYAALSVSERVQVSKKPSSKRAWLITGAFSMGGGIWAMHFIGILCFSLPVPLTFNLKITFLSVIPAILGSGIALYVMSQTSINGWRLQSGALLLALGIGAMHYTGMEAIRLKALLYYDPKLFLLSILVAYALSVLALYIKFYPLKPSLLLIPVSGIKVTSAIIMGNAVVGMHYTAMAAALFYPNPEAKLPGTFISPLEMSMTISGVVSLIIGSVIISTLIDRRLAKAAESIQESEKFSRLLLDSVGEGVIGMDLEGRGTFINPAAVRMLGYLPEEFIGQPINQLIYHPYTHCVSETPAEVPMLEQTRENEDYHPSELLRRKDGTTFPIECTSMPIIKKNEMVGEVLTFTDITERKQAEDKVRQLNKELEKRVEDRTKELQKSKKRLAGILDIAPEGIISIDADYRILIFNEGAQQIFGYTEREALGQSIDILFPMRNRKDNQNYITEFFNSERERIRRAGRREIFGQRKNGEEFPAEESISKFDLGEEKVGTLIIRDISDRKRLEGELADKAIRDSLTGIYNRRHFDLRLKEEVARAEGHNHKLGILIFDLDNFKAINDNHGHLTGDRVLMSVAKTLLKCIRGGDLVFRWGGDEFVVILPETNRDGIYIVADRVREGIIKLGEKRFPGLDVSVGVSLYPEHGTETRTLVQLADRALYIAKKEEDKIHIGMEQYQLNDQVIKVVFQPVMDVRLNQILGFEALGRDASGRQSILGLFKRYRAIGQLSKIKHLCFRLQFERAKKLKLEKLFLNVDFKMLADMKPFPIPPEMEVVLEISEAEALDDIENHLMIAAKWRKQGYKFAMDDFGAGFISLPFISRLVPDYIKLDRSTVLQAVSSLQFRLVLKDLIFALRRTSTDGIIAEGIETREELEIMKALGVYFIQGYLFGKAKEMKKNTDFIKV